MYKRFILLIAILASLFLIGCNQTKHIHIKCEECGKCTDVNCDGL